jgi:hypothetical protein
MDTKFFIIAIISALTLILLMTELSSVRKTFASKIESLEDSIYTNNKKITEINDNITKHNLKITENNEYVIQNTEEFKNIIKKGNNTLSNKFRTCVNEMITQFRTMNDIENQPIRIISDQFEADSNEIVEATKICSIPYLSEMNQTCENKKVKKQSSSNIVSKSRKNDFAEKKSTNKKKSKIIPRERHVVVISESDDSESEGYDSDDISNDNANRNIGDNNSDSDNNENSEGHCELPIKQLVHPVSKGNKKSNNEFYRNNKEDDGNADNIDMPNNEPKISTNVDEIHNTCNGTGNDTGNDTGDDAGNDTGDDAGDDAGNDTGDDAGNNNLNSMNDDNYGVLDSKKQNDSSFGESVEISSGQTGSGDKIPGGGENKQIPTDTPVPGTDNNNNGKSSSQKNTKKKSSRKENTALKSSSKKQTATGMPKTVPKKNNDNKKYKEIISNTNNNEDIISQDISVNTKIDIQSSDQDQNSDDLDSASTISSLKKMGSYTKGNLVSLSEKYGLKTNIIIDGKKKDMTKKDLYDNIKKHFDGNNKKNP